MTARTGFSFPVSLTQALEPLLGHLDDDTLRSLGAALDERDQAVEDTLTYTPATPPFPVVVSADYQMTTPTVLVLANGGVGGITVTLPVTPNRGSVYWVKKIDAGAGAVLVVPTSGTIEGGASATLAAQFDVQGYMSDSVNWWKVTN